MHGWRARVGLITTSVNTVNEPEFYDLVPEGVSVHTARLELAGKANPENTVTMNEDIERCARLLGTANADVVLYGVTAGSFFKGRGYDEEIEATVEEVADAPGLATSASVRRSLDALDVDSVAVATPYIEEFNRRLTDYLEDSGFAVAAMDGLGIEEGFDIGTVSPQEMYRNVLEIDDPAADAIVVSGTNYRTVEVIPELEADLGKPVVSANTASLWDALTTVGIDPTEVDCGALFEQSG